MPRLRRRQPIHRRMVYRLPGRVAQRAPETPMIPVLRATPTARQASVLLTPRAINRTNFSCFSVIAKLRRRPRPIPTPRTPSVLRRSLESTPTSVAKIHRQSHPVIRLAGTTAQSFGSTSRSDSGQPPPLPPPRRSRLPGGSHRGRISKVNSWPQMRIWSP